MCRAFRENLQTIFFCIFGSLDSQFQLLTPDHIIHLMHLVPLYYTLLFWNMMTSSSFPTPGQECVWVVNGIMVCSTKRSSVMLRQKKSYVVQFRERACWFRSQLSRHQLKCHDGVHRQPEKNDLRHHYVMSWQWDRVGWNAFVHNEGNILIMLSRTCGSMWHC